MKLYKITINLCLGNSAQNSSILTNCINYLKLITGQFPVVIYSKKSIANFKLKKNTPISLKVTLRNKLMYVFYNKIKLILIYQKNLINPGIKGSLDTFGNYNIGIKSLNIFSELYQIKGDWEKYGLDINIILKNYSYKTIKTYFIEEGILFNNNKR
uniref:Ribosomal protein L5 n=1 Tax=Piridium sociabile TaxID=2570542 RepID=A0A5B9XUY7_9ALVE|nr:ribosomal protein L5 [Piridium sociabile]